TLQGKLSWLTVEQEPNDLPETANGPLQAYVTGRLLAGDRGDMFYFDVTSLERYQVQIEVLSGSPEIVVTYNAATGPDTSVEDTDSVRIDSRILGSFVPKKLGRHHAFLYNPTGQASQYRLSIRPASQVSSPRLELEPNGVYHSATGPLTEATRAGVLNPG